MTENANKIVFAVVAVLAVVTLSLVFGSGSCSGGGGGGGAPTPGGQVYPSTSGAASIMADEGDDESAFDYSPVAGADKDMSIEEFEALLASSPSAVGENVRNAATSDSVPAASDVYKSFEQRGFDNIALSVDFDLDGKYFSPIVLDASADDKYPSYTGVYTSSQNVVWMIYVNDGSYFAAPLGSANGALSKNIILSEADYVTQYDAQTNEFSDFAINQVPDTTVVKVTQVNKASLDSYTLESLEAL